MLLKKLIFLLLFFIAFDSLAQIDTTFVDNKYRDDQLYIGLNYNLLLNQPDNYDQYGISGGITLGYIRDIPLNKRRNLGLGLGLGYSYNAYSHNLKITDSSIEVVSSDSFDNNRLKLNTLDIPLEIRWRTSTAKKYSFWRIYSGVKFSYLFANSSKFESTTEFHKVTNIDQLNTWTTGVYLSAGYSTFNLNIFYGLTPLFSDSYRLNNGSEIGLNQLHIGMIFYML